MDKFLNKLTEKGEEISVGDFIYYVFSDVKQVLIEIVNADYLLHGSSREIIDKLKPYQAYDKAKEFGNQKGVYLSADPIQAIFTALTGGVKGIKARRNSIKTMIDNKGKIVYLETYFAVSNPECIREKGYIYVFPKRVADTVENNEYIAQNPIKPEIVIKVDREDFPYKIEKI